MLTLDESNKVRAAKAALMGILKDFMPVSQRNCLADALRGEERVGIAEVVLRATEQIETMPKTYEQDGLGDAAVAHLHYFRGSVDAWITEKDKGDGSEDTAQYQAFGKQSFYGPDSAEMGYISIKELIENGVELDLYWEPKTLKEAFE